MWQPLNEVYLVRPDEIKVSPLILDQFKSDHVELRTGIVVYVGTGQLLESGERSKMQVLQGEKVLFGAKVGHKVKVGDEDLLLLAEANILAVER